MSISVFDIFTVGIGPSSSHTVGPMRAARQFVNDLACEPLALVAGVKVELYGSLGATGKGHGTASAVMLGLQGESPETVDADSIAQRIATIKTRQQLPLLGLHNIPFSENDAIIFHRRDSLPYHPNGLRITAYGHSKQPLLSKVYYSVGGGFVIDEQQASSDCLVEDPRPLPYAFGTGDELLALCRQHGLSISRLMWHNETAWRSEQDIRAGLLALWEVMKACVIKGVSSEGELPGGMQVKRRAREMHQQLLSQPEATLADPLSVMDWVTLYALAVNEENAAGGRIVTAPTNGAAGIIPAVLHYYRRFVPGANDEGVLRFLLTAAAIAILYKKNASISGAEVGCQGEVGSACSMAAAALTEVMGGTPAQVENAAEIAMEHNLGLTCDPVGGLVQVPCIERNAMASIKAIHASRMALKGDGSHFVSLDKVIKTMRDTGRDMQDKYKETSRGGLAVNVVEVPVNIIEC